MSILLVTCLLLCGGSSTDPEETSPIGQPLAAFKLASHRNSEIRWPDSTAQGPAFIHVFQPDCPACEAQARALEELRSRTEGLTVVGVAHRGSSDDIAEFRARSGVGYSLAVGTGTEWAHDWGVGDPMYAVDADGVIRYQQVGFHEDDVPTWDVVATALLDGEIPRPTTVERSVVTLGEVMPEIALPGVDGTDFRLFTERGVLRSQAGNDPPRPRRAAIGFFSRY